MPRITLRSLPRRSRPGVEPWSVSDLSRDRVGDFGGRCQRLGVLVGTSNGWEAVSEAETMKFLGAGEGTRTLDVNLGKVALSDDCRGFGPDNAPPVELGSGNSVSPDAGLSADGAELGTSVGSNVGFCAPAAHVSSRFWTKVDRSAGPDGCWLWTGALNSDGYPVFASKSTKPIKLVLAHRFSWEMANGCQVPAGLQLMHACDVRRCVNPAHLSPGSARENAQDAVRKKRFKGMANAPRIGRHSHRSPRKVAA